MKILGIIVILLVGIRTALGYGKKDDWWKPGVYVNWRLAIWEEWPYILFRIIVALIMLAWMTLSITAICMMNTPVDAGIENKVDLAAIISGVLAFVAAVVAQILDEEDLI